MGSCSPADLIVFMESHWLARHAGTLLPDGSMIASPSGVNGSLSSLSTGFSLLGRLSDWDPFNKRGNPVLSTDVSQWRQAYSKEAWRSGYLEGSAVPMQTNKEHQLVDYLDQCILSGPAGHHQLLSARDLMPCLLMWETPLRGKDCGKITLGDFFLPDGQSILLANGQMHLLSDLVPVGSQLVLRPKGTKTVKCQRSGPFTLTAAADSQHSFLARLLSRWYKSPCYLFSPLSADRRSFEGGPMQFSNIGNRLKQHLEAAGLYAGESNHGFRREQIQGMAAQGISRQQVGEAVQIKTASVVDLYADVSRHVPRLQRMQQRQAMCS